MPKGSPISKQLGEGGCCTRMELRMVRSDLDRHAQSWYTTRISAADYLCNIAYFICTGMRFTDIHIYWLSQIRKKKIYWLSHEKKCGDVIRQKYTTKPIPIRVQSPNRVGPGKAETTLEKEGKTQINTNCRRNQSENNLRFKIGIKSFLS